MSIIVTQIYFSVPPQIFLHIVFDNKDDHAQFETYNSKTAQLHTEIIK